MALKISRAAAHGAAPIASQAGTIMAAVFTYTFNEDFTAASDKLEIGVIPAHAQPLRLEVIGVGVGAITADVGVMSGDAAETDDARTVGDEFIDGVSINGASASADIEACLAVAKSESHRGLGVVLSGDVAAGSAKTITVVLEYTY